MCPSRVAKSKHSSGPLRKPSNTSSAPEPVPPRFYSPTAGHLPMGLPSLVKRTTNREAPFEHSLALPQVMSRRKSTPFVRCSAELLSPFLRRAIAKEFLPTYDVTTCTLFQAASLLVLINLDFLFGKEWSTSPGCRPSVARSLVHEWGFSPAITNINNYKQGPRLDRGW